MNLVVSGEMRRATLLKSIYCVLSPLYVCGGRVRFYFLRGGMISGHCPAFSNHWTVIAKSYPLGLPNVTESYVLKYGSTILGDGRKRALEQ